MLPRCYAPPEKGMVRRRRASIISVALLPDPAGSWASCPPASWLAAATPRRQTFRKLHGDEGGGTGIDDKFARMALAKVAALVAESQR